MSDGITESRRGTYFLDRSLINRFDMERRKIFDQIELERKYQDKKWGDEFDRKNTVNDWATYINIYLSRATTMGVSKEEQRKAMVKVATLAVAALERFDENGGFAPRHYDE